METIPDSGIKENTKLGKTRQGSSHEEGGEISGN